MIAYKPTPGGALQKKGSTLALARRSEGFWILPSISRPQNLTRLIESYRAVEEEAPVVVFLWRDDPRFAENMNQDWPQEWTVLVEEERFTAGDAMRRAFKYAPKAAFYGFLADDIVFKTKWSEQLASAATPCFVSYPSDGIQNERLCTHFVCGGDLVREIGWWALPGLEHSGLDLVWMAIGSNCPGLLKYRPDVWWDHLHPIAQRGDNDEIYEYAKGLREQDDRAYQDWVKNRIVSDVNKARKLLYDQ